jgi:hypothetical protein
VQSGRDRPALAQFVVGLASLFRGPGDELDAGSLERMACLVSDLHAAVGALADDEQVWLGIKHRPEVIAVQAVPLLALPAGDDTVGQDDDVPGVGLAIHDEASEAVRFDLWRTHGFVASFHRQGKGSVLRS